MTDTPELNVWRESCRCYEDGAARDLALPMRDMVVAGDQSAAAVIRSYGDQRDAEGYAQAVADVVAWLRRDGDRVASVSTPRMQTDNLAIILCNQFDNPDQQSDADTGWTPDAVEGCNEAIGAVVAYFAHEITRRFGKGQDHG